MNLREALLTGVSAAAIVAAASGTAWAGSPAAHNWTGFYVGGHVGYGDANFEGCIECTSVPPGTGDILDAGELDLDGVVGGPHAGFNFQISSLVLGIEGDVTFVDFEDTASAPGPFSSGEPMEAGDHQIGEVDFLASIRARLGWAFDRALVFATGGAALAEADWVTQQHGNRDEVEFNDVGGVAGGGLEWAVTNALSVRAEGLYYFFDDEEGVGHFHSAASSPPFDGPVEFDDAIVGRLGVSWYFGRSPL